MEQLLNVEVNYCKVGGRCQLRIAIKQPGNKGLDDSSSDGAVFSKKWTEFSEESSCNGNVAANNCIDKIKELVKLLTVDALNI